jgi:hypothetical protein
VSQRRIVGGCRYRYASEANFDKTNYQYLLRGLLVHLDDPSPEIQAEVKAVLGEAARVDPPVCAEELRTVRERQRTPKLVDELLATIAGIGQLV